ncbi:HK97 gp10 family phage protein [Paenactinomyces guangxiensis]|uniref:HK97 gp10 family phage protein n=1 Tax=Paenactinomyces guangxiensis TaxID=1490290 RepID=A0A7W1WSN0_9BACL|nr:HK97 gp10 family phage protein [Paenactinomyces guangxiensis]MBA4495101.1 HK97 gp10 family phage protein [Paenactinomyces guangxiensis]MBH8592215.1 HK97 gp10 family phage protein [Paenactinomyces guangxiensis]
MAAGVEVKINRKSFQNSGLKMEAAARQAVNNILAFGVGEAKKNSPVKTGHLRRSIHVLDSSSKGGRYGTNIIYARIQEEGGKIRAKRAKYLRFKIGNRWVTVKEVKIKPKRYLKRSASTTQANVPRLVRKAIREAKL